MQTVPKRVAAAGQRLRRPRSKIQTRNFDLIAIGASAGGFHALSQVLSSLPADLPVSVVIVQHLNPRHKSQLSALLSRLTSMTVRQASHGDTLQAGVVYIAPPDEHLLVRRGKLRLVHTKAVRYSRPSIDLLFESVAQECGTRAIGVVLSGSLSDGSGGLRCIKEAGGVTIVEDPAEAEFPSMPQAALATGCVDHVLPLVGIGPALVTLCSGDLQRNVG